jgi:hypothetical protein
VEFVSTPVGDRKAPAKVISKRYKARRLRRIVNAGLGALGVAGLLLSLIVINRLEPDRRLVDRESTATPPAAGRSVKIESLAAQARPIYRHSVVPGGVRSAEEVANVIQRDPVVAAHYKDINPQKMRNDRLQKPLLAHVSYRLGDKVYWTKKPVPLPANEPIMTDGVTTIRERCGNLISVDPLAPASDNEPSPASLDVVTDPDAMAWQRLDYAAPGVLVSINPEAAPGFMAGPTSFPNFMGLPGSGASRPGANPGETPPTKEVDPPTWPVIPPTDPTDPTNPTDPTDPTYPVDPGVPITPIEAPVPVPEPSTLMLFGLGGAAGVAQYLRKRAKTRARS